MIVQCPKCSTRYRIAEEKLPAGGGKIRCPGCSHAFVVRLEQNEPAPVPSTPSPAPPPPRVGPAARRMPAGAAPLRSDGWDIEGDLLNREVPRPQASAAAPHAAPSMDADTAWKLRNAIGLILDFSDTESLINWLKSRDSFDGIVVSRDEGATWSPLADVPELANVQPTGRRTIMGMAAIGPRGPAPEPAAAPSAAPQSAPGPIAASSPAGPEPDLDAPPSGAQSALDIRAQAQARLAAKRAARAAETGPEPKEEPKPKYSRIRQSKKETNPFLVWAALLVAFLLLGIVLQAAGVITFFEPKSDTGQEIVVNAPPSAAEPEAPQPASADDALQNEVEESFERADQAVSQGNYGDAIAHLERARSLQPDNRQISCRLAGLYGQIEQPERAQEARDRCQGR